MRRKFATWALVYAIAVIYVSVAIGPDGFHFVVRDPGEAWRTLLATPYVLNGSDQRADWMANLAMAVPLAFLGMGIFWTQKRGVRRWFMTGLLLVCCFMFVTGVKYAQLFFPPRTVTLNYILAQCLGSVLGVVSFWTFRQKIFAPHPAFQDIGERSLNVVLRAYAVALFLYFLFPFDFVLSAGDAVDRVAALPKFLLAWPGEGRSTGVRIILVLANIAETIPLGIMLAVGKREVSVPRIAATGLVMMSVATVAAMFVMSATPNLVSVILRMVGMVIGAGATMQLRNVDTTRLRTLLERSAPMLFVPYVLSVLYINGLLSDHWRTIDEAVVALDLHGLLPFWHYYIVSKAQAMASLAIHAVTFAPIGVLISLRGENQEGKAGMAALVAFLFSVAIELGRWFKPGLQPDFSDAIIAAISAWLAVKAMPIVWQMADVLSAGTQSPKGAEGTTAR